MMGLQSVEKPCLRVKHRQGFLHIADEILDIREAKPWKGCPSTDALHTF